MGRRVPQHIFEEETVEFDDGGEEDEEDHAEETLGGGENLPLETRPVVGPEGTRRSGGTRVLRNASPVESVHFKVVHDKVTQEDTDGVAQQNVQNQLIPPTFSKIRQNVGQRQFAHFEQNRPRPTHINVAEQEGLGEPTHHVSHHKLIVDRIHHILKFTHLRLGRVNSAIRRIITLGQGHTQLGIQIRPNLSRVVGILE